MLIENCKKGGIFMYRNIRGNRQQCNCNQAPKEDVLEDKCDDVLSLEDMNLKDECDCGFDEDEGMFPTNAVLGQSYVPRQILNTTFKPEVGLKMGTIFPELVSPYMPGQSMAEIEYIRRANKIKEGCNSV